MHKILLITLSIMCSVRVGSIPIEVKFKNMPVEGDYIQFYQFGLSVSGAAHSVGYHQNRVYKYRYGNVVFGTKERKGCRHGDGIPHGSNLQSNLVGWTLVFPTVLLTPAYSILLIHLFPKDTTLTHNYSLRLPFFHFLTPTPRRRNLKALVNGSLDFSHLW